VFDGREKRYEIAQEEIFGPVLAVIPFNGHGPGAGEGQQDIIRIVRWRLDRDVKKAHKLAASIKAATIWVNCYNMFEIRRFHSRLQNERLRAASWVSTRSILYTNIKSVWMNLAD